MKETKNAKIKKEIFRKILHTFSLTTYFVYVKFGIENTFSYIIICLITSLILEIIRLKAFNFFPLKWIVKIVEREGEQWKLGAHVYFFIGSFFAILISWNEKAIISILSAAFSDAIAAIIGISLGKMPNPINRNKKIEGSLAGMITTFFIVYIFMNKLLDPLILAVIFLVTDCINNAKINDNMMLPILFSATLNILGLLK